MITTSLLFVLTTLISNDTGPKNLDFRQPKLQHWTGQGLRQTTLKTATGKSMPGVTSKGWNDRKNPAFLYQTFTLPKNAGTLHVHAWAVTRSGREDRKVDVYLEASGRRVIEKQVLKDGELKDASAILPSSQARALEHVWSVSDRAGENVRVVILDMDGDPDHYVVTSGVTIRPKSAFQTERFQKEISKLTSSHQLVALKAWTTPGFITLSNADEQFTQTQINHCEAFHDLFLQHFRNHGFDVHVPGDRLKIAMFRSQKGYEAVLGAPLGSFVTGIYQPQQNRLVVYDFGRNRDLKRHREKMRERIRSARTDLERRVLAASLSRQLEEIRGGTNVSTLMHETAHLISFNCGLLNRNGDVPLWLAEGLACYCEASSDGRWLGIGKKSAHRVKTLKEAFAGKRDLVPLHDLLRDDKWFRGPNAAKYGLIGYAQSWALFRMLMEEKPRALNQYLKLIRDRRTADHRLTDFAESFGADLEELEKKHHQYLKQVVQGR